MGMVLDAAIVVSENILRIRERGEIPSVAALAGTSQVKGALLASTATTVAIFLPVLFLQDVRSIIRRPCSDHFYRGGDFADGGAHRSPHCCGKLAETKKTLPG